MDAADFGCWENTSDDQATGSPDARGSDCDNSLAISTYPFADAKCRGVCPCKGKVLSYGAFLLRDTFI
ncbi:hypothetical protein EUGRSUZ_C03580 [Eucalyptus grandis]|uniref:Uncharacterized protein n=1 Tax=Eucalyptus grandis TaxID=71139 RepID=A0ACC3LI92_EUCGR|nr:hypothetical protein EUGRSUZ_C03580 [Eucalyptus grandis]